MAHSSKKHSKKSTVNGNQSIKKVQGMVQLLTIQCISQLNFGSMYLSLMYLSPISPTFPPVQS